jgi:hypothetical protein
MSNRAPIPTNRVDATYRASACSRTNPLRIFGRRAEAQVRGSSPCYSNRQLSPFVSVKRQEESTLRISTQSQDSCDERTAHFVNDCVGLDQSSPISLGLLLDRPLMSQLSKIGTLVFTLLVRRMRITILISQKEVHGSRLNLDVRVLTSSDNDRYGLGIVPDILPPQLFDERYCPESFSTLCLSSSSGRSSGKSTLVSNDVGTHTFFDHTEQQSLNDSIELVVFGRRVGSLDIGQDLSPDERSERRRSCHWEEGEEGLQKSIRWAFEHAMSSNTLTEHSLNRRNHIFVPQHDQVLNDRLPRVVSETSSSSSVFQN